MQKKVMVQAIGLVLSGLFVAGAANAADQKPVQVAETSVLVQGVQVAIDPATGQLVAPTAAQRAALSAAMVQRAAASQAPAARGLSTADLAAAPRNESEALKTFRTLRLRDGRTAVGMDLPESLMSSLVAERRADGSLDIHHAGDVNPARAVEVTK
jgi:hypothetical protein